MRALVPYIRKSSKSDAQSEATFEQQMKEIEAYVSYECRRGVETVLVYPVDTPFTEAFTGSTSDRPEFAAALDYMDENNADGLIVYDISRFMREVESGLRVMRERFTENGKSLVSTRENIDTTKPLGKFFFIILLAQAEMEVANFRDRALRGKKAHLENGGYNGGPYPYGWAPVERDKRKYLEEVADEQRVIAWILDCSGRGLYPAAIARSLNEHKEKPPGGSEKWSPAQVERVIKHAKQEVSRGN